MERKIKLIWDFYGEDASKTAEHHAIHLREFMGKNEIKVFGIDTEEQKEMHTTAYVITEEKNMILLRDSLRPKRGEWVEEK